jgi:hypothetical protein
MDDRGTNPHLRTENLAPTMNEPAAFVGTLYRFQTGARTGVTVPVRNAEGDTILTYTSFASAIGIVAALMAGIVAVAGIAGALFLLQQERPLPAIAAAMLAIFFALFIAMLVPATNVRVMEGDVPAFAIAQTSRFAFPRASFAVITANGETLARIRRSLFSRMGRNRWRVTTAEGGRVIAEAEEESLSQAIVRKFAGKFSRRFESNVRLRAGFETVGWIYRRPQPGGGADVLDISFDTGRVLDRRVAVALATLILGAEP